MAIKQTTTPNINVPARSGYCLKYVDDTVNAPSRQPNATAAFNIENANGNIRVSQPPVNVWVPGFLGLTREPLGHVFWAYNHGNGQIEIHDSEVHSGRRGAYNSLDELYAWFRNYGPSYRGWSYWIDGVQAVEDAPDAPAPSGQTLVLPANAPTWRVYNVNGPYTVGHEVATLKPGKFGGLTYSIERWISGTVCVIKTQDFGEVAIYVAPSTGAVIK